MKKMLKRISAGLAVMLLSVSFTAFAADGDIVDIASKNDDFSILVAALQKADLVETLQGTGPFTVFAPTNAAFEDLLKTLDITAEQLLAQPDLAKVLTYHVVSGKVMSTDLTDGMTPSTVNGETIKVDLSSGVKINDAKVTTADLEATNGVIHVIDKVLVPANFKLQVPEAEKPEAEKPTTPGTIVDIASGNKDFSILVAALQKAKLVETLQGAGPFTVFAPTNAAFEALLKSLNITAEQLLAQPDLAKVLTYHVVSGKVMSTDLKDGMEPATVNGQKLKIDLKNGVKVNNANVTTADIEASNGVIHVIDTILVPENFKLQAVDMKETEAPKTGLPVAFPFLLTAALTGGAGLLVFKRKKA